MERDWLEKIDFVLDSVSTLGIDLPEPCRWKTVREVFEEGTRRVIGPEEPLYLVAREGCRDVLILEYVFDHIPLCDQSDDLKSLIARVMKDPVDPLESGENSCGRDAQVELYVYGACHAAGFRPVTLQEPDVACGFGEGSVGLAVKRIKNQRNFTDRFKKGVIQILNSRMKGIVFCDVALAFNPSNSLARRPRSESLFSSVWSEDMKAFTASKIDYLNKCVRGRDVIGLVLYDHVLSFVPEEPVRLDAMTYIVPLGRSSLDRFLFDEFCRRFTHALPNISSTDSPIIIP